MSPAWLRKRSTADGARRYQVLYRRGGRGWPIETGGTFKNEREAKLRRDVIAGWLAQGLNPKVELAALATQPAPARELRAGITAFLASRVDVEDDTRTVIRYALKKLDPLADRDPGSITVADLQELVNGLTKIKPSTIGMYVSHWKPLFDFLGATPNPARSKHLRLPAIAAEQIDPPTWKQFLAAIDKISARYHLPLVVLEQTGMRVGELESLAWGDVDETTSRFRLRAGATKTKRSRWVQVPEWLMQVISETCPIEDRVTDRRVFGRFNADSARNALRAACAAAGVPHFSPHDLRHRRATIWHHSGLPVRVQMERGGWTRSEIPLEVYSHLMPLDEAPIDRLMEVL